MPKRTVVLITGGSGFIGSCYARTVLRDHPDWTIRLLDVLTYAGTLVNIAEFDDQIEFVRGDVAGPEAVNQVVEGCTYVIHFAAEALGWSGSGPSPMASRTPLTGIANTSDGGRLFARRSRPLCQQGP